MNDDDRQAERLRERLDHELMTVRATTEARERLDSRIAPSFGAQPVRWNLRRLPAVLALPVAVAGVVVAVVAVPALLRSDSTSIPPAGRVTQSGPAPAPTPTKTSAAAPSAMPSPAPSPATPQPVESAPGKLRLRATPRIVEAGQPVVLTLTGAPRRSGEVTVTWADGSGKTVVPGSCTSSSETSTRPLAHTYTRGGRYSVRVVIGDCADGVAAQARVTVDVTVVQPTAARPR